MTQPPKHPEDPHTPDDSVPEPFDGRAVNPFAPPQRWTPPAPPVIVPRTPRAQRPGAPRAVLAAAAVTAVAAATLVDGVGGNLLLVALAAAVTAFTALKTRTKAAAEAGERRRGPWAVVWGLAGLVLAAVPVVGADSWLLPLVLVAALAAGSLALSGGRGWWALLSRPFAVFAAVPHGLDWGLNGIAGLTKNRRGNGGALLRALIVTGFLAAIFGALFAAADAVFADLFTALAPEGGGDGLGTFLLRLIVAAAGTAFAFVAASAAVRPHRWKTPAVPAPKVASRIEWLLPMAVLNLLFLAFAVVQCVVLFGGVDGPLGDDTSRAEYARQGFWALLTATALTLVVLGVALYAVPRARPGDRRAVKVLSGTLAVSTLVIGAASLYRSKQYVDDFGLTRDRLTMGAVEVWICAALALLVVALLLRAAGRALPRLVAAAAVLTLGVLAFASPDALVARHSVDRYERTGKIDTDYVRDLSPAAVPELDKLPEPLRSCVLEEIAEDVREEKPWYATSVARERARDILRKRPLDKPVNCWAVFTRGE